MVLLAGCGGSGVPPVGTRELVEAPDQWSQLMLEAYDLEPINQLADIRGRMRRAHITGMIDLVAVPSSFRALVVAQEHFHVDRRDRILGLGRMEDLNALEVLVARSVDSDGWERLRHEARRAGVNVVLERLDTDEPLLQPVSRCSGQGSSSSGPGCGGPSRR